MVTHFIAIKYSFAQTKAEMKKIYCVILLLIVAQLAYSQTGKIVGKVISTSTGRTLGGATILLLEKSISKAADQNGVFDFSKIEPGTYSINCSYAGYQSKIIEEIIVKLNENTEINISLDLKTDDAVVVTAKRIKAAGETVASLLVAQKNSANVSDGITAQSIKRTPDRSSSDVIKRISGASIQDDKFAIIRGLNDRYNAAFINGAPLPSTESDRKAFAFDIFPSAILDNLIIYKTATPDKSGEFAGGLIELATKSVVAKNFTTISIGQGYNTLLTGKTRYYSEAEGKSDRLGLDDGRRGVPKDFPSTQNFNALTAEQKLEKAKLFKNIKWGVKNDIARPNFNFQLASGFNIQRKEKEFLSAVFSVNYNRTYTFTAGERKQYNVPSGADEPVLERDFIDSIYNEEIIWAVLGNVSVKLNNKNNISWKNNYSVNTDNKLVRRIGRFDVPGEPESFLKETGRLFTQGQIYSSQLLGEHQVGNKRTKVNWLAGYSKINREIPNIARTQYLGRFPDVDNTLSSIPTGIPLFGATGGMFSTNSDENIKNIKADISQPFSFSKNIQNLMKIGGGFQKRERFFTSRNLGFVQYTGSVLENDISFKNLPQDQIFLEQYLGLLTNGKAGISIADATLSNSSYEASSSIAHGYLMNDQRFYKKFRLIYGIRVESFNQKLNTPKSTEAVNLDSTVVDVLPSANFVFAATPKINVRLSYTETVNRPEFRELAPFLFYEFVSGFSVVGDSTLTRARIKNYDFRFEFFPGNAQLLSFSGFYKKFKNPIELVRSPDFPNELKYNNNGSAKAYGIEAEFRFLLGTIFGANGTNDVLNRLSLSGNAALIKSSVQGKEGTRNFQGENDRALQGQSPYLINGSLGYTDDKNGLSSTVSVNRIGDRLVIAGSGFSANIYERARTVVDFQLAKSFIKNKVELKFNARDILAQNIFTYNDFEKSGSFKNGTNDRVFASNNAPTTLTFTATFKL